MATKAEEFSEAATWCAIGWIAGRADSVLGEKLFIPRAIEELCMERPWRVFAFVAELEDLIRDEFIRRGHSNPPNLKMFLRGRLPRGYDGD